MRRMIVLFMIPFIFAACEKSDITSKEHEKERLESIYKEIAALASSVECEDEADWTFTAFGSKPCGGPSGHIAYSNKIDTTYLLGKVAQYTELEKKYNKKWQIVSDCMNRTPPSGVICVNGSPELVYQVTHTN